MCAPDKEETLTAQRRAVLKKGTRYGALSLGLLMVAVSLTMPHLQGRRDELGCDSLCQGSMSSARSALSLVGATLVGRLSDVQITGVSARKLCLWLGLVALGVATLMANQAATLQQLWMSIVPGALQQNMTLLKALFSEYQEAIPGGTTPGERASSAGILGMAGGLAMMVGPVVGAVLLKDYDQATGVSMLCLVAAAVLVYRLPQPAVIVKKEKKVLNKSWWSFLDVPSARSPAALFLLVCRLLATLSFHIYQTIWTVSLKERFHFQPADYGRFFSMIGLFYALSQGYFARFCLDRFAGKSATGRVRLLGVCSLLVGILRYWAVQTNSIVTVYVLYAFMVTAIGIISTCFTADTSQIASPTELGSFFGLVASVEAGAGMAGPLLGGVLSKWGGNEASLAAVLGLNAVVLVLVLVGYEGMVLKQFQKQREKTD